MANEHTDFGGGVDASTLQLPRAVAIVAFLLAGRANYATLVRAHRDGSGTETVVVDLDIEVPQAPVHALERVERVAIRFSVGDQRVPEVRALRHGFPQVPHLQLISESYPKSLCLYDQPWAELRLRWTPMLFIERIREWMALTARGELHGDDQPLEPLLLEWEHVFVLPVTAMEQAAKGEPVRLYVHEVPQAGPGSTLIGRTLHFSPNPEARRRVATMFRCDPQQHGIIQHAPKNLEDLHRFASSAGLDLKAQLQQSIRDWRELHDIHDARLIVLLWLPKTRTPSVPAETGDLWAFELKLSIKELGVLLKVWAVDGNHVVPLLGEIQPAGLCDKVPISILNPLFTLSAEGAAHSNGTTADANPFVAVGAGALGSQVLMNLVRCGYGTWTIIDRDFLYPHNLARHALDGSAVGHPKAVALARQVSSIRDGETASTALVADLLDPGDSEPAIYKACTEARGILDLSASVPVARALARSVPGNTRRVSLFLNPSGSELVMLAEDEKREIKLDHLEHQLYRELLTNPALANHFAREQGRIRYARSCRDISSTLPQHLVGLHAAIASKAFRDAMSQPGAVIRIWHAGPDLQVNALAFEAQKVHEHAVGPWTVCTDEAFIRKIRTLRLSKLPNETGGILIGSFDLERRIIYLVDTVASPPDSEEWPTLYIRGASGLAAQVNRIGEQTAGMLQYVGEWHSHPRGVPALPSGDDCKVFLWLTELMDRDGFPAIMLIASDTHESVFVANMVQGEKPQ